MKILFDDAGRKVYDIVVSKVYIIHFILTENPIP